MVSSASDCIKIRCGRGFLHAPEGRKFAATEGGGGGSASTEKKSSEPLKKQTEHGIIEEGKKYALPGNTRL